MAFTRSVLIAEDSPDTRDIIATALANDSWTVECAATVRAAEARLDRGGVDVLVADLGISPIGDVRTLRCIRRHQLTADRLLRFVDELSSDLSEDDRRNTGAAFREILVNAMEHGGKFDAAKRVEITRVRTAGMLMYLVRDPGPGFDFTNLPHAAVSSPDDPVRHVAYRDEQGMRAGGFGLLVAAGLVDELVHSSKGNEAVLLKYLSGTPDPASQTRTSENV